jgi:hypothetical protein
MTCERNPDLCSCMETLCWIILYSSYIIITKTMFKLKILLNNNAISAYYCMSHAMMIQQTTSVWLNFVSVKYPHSEAIFTHSIIEYAILELGLTAFISLEPSLLAFLRNPTKVFAASSYHFYPFLINSYASLVFPLSVSFPFQHISTFVIYLIF